MKQRQKKKILKRVAGKMYAVEFGQGPEFTRVERKVSERQLESKMTAAIQRLNTEEYAAGTLYESGYMARLMQAVNEAGTIENVTGVKKPI